MKCIWVSSYDLFASARKAVFPVSTAFTDWKTHGPFWTKVSPHPPPPESKISGSVPAKGTVRQNWPTSQTSSVVNAEKYEYLNISGYFYLVVTNHSKGKLENHKLITIVACSIVNFTSDCFFPWNTLTLQIYFWCSQLSYFHSNKGYRAKALKKTYIVLRMNGPAG